MTISKIKTVLIGTAMAAVMAVPAFSVASGPQRVTVAQTIHQKVQRKIEKARKEGRSEGKRIEKNRVRRHHRKMRMRRHIRRMQMRKHMK